ncbi:hypothetical protein [Polyangium fumosum]|uniref:XRE family transcriptional regulator n=1 Tax=Polyangium fumosum TaxID=889272 RepID=A0A4U1JAM0_9BACT|nr:hypothetical protein [Polyangium fumosum]TKD06344.1 hypothetical protein E8A74_20730 [Polyangium fumosum]
MSEPDQDHDDQGPLSLPAVLTDEQAARVRKALAPHVAARGLWKAADAIGYAPMYVRAVLHGEIACTLHFATCVAHALDVEVESLVRGDST